MAAKRDSAVLSTGMVVAAVVLVVAVDVGKPPSATGLCRSGDKGMSSNVPSPSNSSTSFESGVGF